MKRILFDVEGDGLLSTVTKLHCVCTVDVDTGEEQQFGPGGIHAALEYLKTADILIAHFGIGYDFPVLKKLYGFEVPEEKQLDTVVVARLLYPHIKDLDAARNQQRLLEGRETMGSNYGRQSIEAWGIRLNQPKLHADIEDWSEWTAEMQERCMGDVRTCLALWRYLNLDNSGASQDAIKLEHRVARVCQAITADGWPFDERAAHKLHADLLDAKHNIEVKLREQFGGWYQEVSQFTPKKDNASRGYVAGAAFTKIAWTEFNPQSARHLERCLTALGWKPTVFTDSGQPVFDEETIEAIAAEHPEAKGITEYKMICKRLGQLAEGEQAWLKKVGEDGRIHASYNPMGTVTGRAAHYDPNIAQVPSCASPYGHECRSLFTVPEGWVMVGADMEGLEGRCQAHYMAKTDGGAFGRVLLQGDAHWENAIALGLAEGPRDKENRLHTLVREGSKRWYYAWIYGSGTEKSGRIILDCCRGIAAENPAWGYLFDKYFSDGTGERQLKKVGRSLQEVFLRKTPALGILIRKIKDLAERVGYLPGLDGRRVPVRSAHSAFNALLQSAGAVLCKRWLADADDALRAEGLVKGWSGDYVILGWIHDEIQIACRDGHQDTVGRLLTSTACSAGSSYGFRIPLASTYKVGRTWAGTH
jgi:DNA polymerase-1